MTEQMILVRGASRGEFFNLRAATSFEVTQGETAGTWTTVAKFGAGEHVDYAEVPGLASASYEEAHAKFDQFATAVLGASFYREPRAGHG